MRESRRTRAWLLMLVLGACSASHGEQGNSSGSNWLRCSTLSQCTSSDAVSCSSEGYCLNAAGGRIAAPAANDGTGGVSTRDYALCDGSNDMRLAVVSEGGFLDSTYAFTNPFGHAFLFVDGTCHYYASRQWDTGIVEGELSAAQAAQYAQSIQLQKLSQLAYHDLETCPDAGIFWVRAGTGRSDCSCTCDASAPALVAPLMDAVSDMHDELEEQGGDLQGEVELFALANKDDGVPRSGDLTWPFSWPITEVSVTQEELNQDSSVPRRRTLRDDEARTARAFRASALRGDPPSARTMRVVASGVGYLVYMRDVLPVQVQERIRQVMQAQAAVLSSQ
jgi:hypothetical protein